VTATHLDITERANVMGDAGYKQPDGEKCDEEADTGEKKTAVRSVRDLLVNQQSQFSQMQSEQNQRRHDADKDEQYP
jgi:hypothetical protein